MKQLFIILIFATSAFLNNPVFAEYKIFEYKRIYNSEFLSVGVTSESATNNKFNAGNNFDQILSVLADDRQTTFHIRVSGLPFDTRKELLEYYSREIPMELNKAKRSSGIIHNPTLKPLSSLLSKAFKTTK